MNNMNVAARVNPESRSPVPFFTLDRTPSLATLLFFRPLFPQLVMALMQNRYLSGDYAAENPTYHVEDSAWKAQQILKMINKHGLQPKSVCEVGCGAGEILKQLQERLPAQTLFYGFEISPQAFALTRSRENDRLHFFCHDLLAAEVEPYELLLCNDVFEHVEDYIGFLRRLRIKSTHQIFHIPLDISAQAVVRIGTIVENRKRVGHLHYFSKETALLTLQDAGYEIVDWFYTASGIDRAKTWGAKLAALPRQPAAFFQPGFCGARAGWVLDPGFNEREAVISRRDHVLFAWAAIDRCMVQTFGINLVRRPCIRFSTLDRTPRIATIVFFRLLFP